MTDSLPTDRHAVILPALCWGRQHSDFYAVTADITAQGIGFRSAIVPEIGIALTCSIRFVGTVETRIVTNGPNTFGVRLSVPREQAAAIARTMWALAREQDRPPEGDRRHRRIAPRRRDVLVTLGDGRAVPGRLVNVSASGAAVALARPIEVGESVTLGSTAGRVVRRFAEGIGVVFDAALDPALVDPGIRL
jgi:hypothetical protein